MNMEKQQLYPSQTKGMARHLIRCTLLGSKGKQGYRDSSVKLGLKNRYGISQVMGSLIIYHWHVTQNTSVGSHWWRFVPYCGFQRQHCLLQQKNVQFHKLSIASSLSWLYFIMQQTEIIKAVPDLLSHILFQLSISVTHQQRSFWGFLGISTVIKQSLRRNVCHVKKKKSQVNLTLC